jgi:hypothetical protein
MLRAGQRPSNMNIAHAVNGRNLRAKRRRGLRRNRACTLAALGLVTDFGDTKSAKVTVWTGLSQAHMFLLSGRLAGSSLCKAQQLNCR